MKYLVWVYAGNHGRLSRLPYNATIFWPPLLAIIFLCSIVSNNRVGLSFFICLIWWLILLFFHRPITLKRCHDLGRDFPPKPHWFLRFFMRVDYYDELGYIFERGTIGSNKYWDDPCSYPARISRGDFFRKSILLAGIIMLVWFVWFQAGNYLNFFLSEYWLLVFLFLVITLWIFFFIHFLWLRLNDMGKSWWWIFVYIFSWIYFILDLQWKGIHDPILDTWAFSISLLFLFIPFLIPWTSWPNKYWPDSLRKSR